MSRALALSLALLSCSALAEEARKTVLEEPERGLFTGDAWRYRHANLVGDLLLRIVADVVAIPSGAPWWSTRDWLLVGGVVGSTVALSVGRPSLDVQFHALV